MKVSGVLILNFLFLTLSSHIFNHIPTWNFHGPTGKDTRENTSLNYFKLIDLERTLKLYDIFQLDFEMFNYSVIAYLNLFS